MDSTGSTTFSNVNFIVPKDGSKTLTVKATLNTVSGGAVSGADLKVELEDDNFEARGTNSSTVIVSATSGLDLDVVGNTKIIRKTKITIDKLTTSSTVQNGSEQDLYKFKVTADSAEDAALRQMVFRMTFTDNQGTADSLSVGGLKLQRNGVDITSQVCISASTTGADLESSTGYTEAIATSTGQVVVVFGNLAGEEIITKGTSNTYTLRGAPTGFGTGIDNDSVSVELLSDTAAQTASHKYIEDSDTDAGAGTGEISIVLSDNANANSVANIIWSDFSAIPHLSAVDDGGSGLTLTRAASTTNVVAVAQIDTLTPANVQVGDVFTLSGVSDADISFTATVATVANVTDGFTTAINATSSATVTAADDTTLISITADTAGTAFSATSAATNGSTTDDQTLTRAASTTNVVAVAQVDTLTPANVAIGDIFTVSGVSDSAVSFTATVATVANVTAGLANAINATSSATVTAADGTTLISITADTAGTAFTAVTSVTDAADTTTTSADWINGYLLKNMPIGASSMNN